jgi:hypothetical protein
MPKYLITYKWNGEKKTAIVKGKTIGSARRGFMRRFGKSGEYPDALADVGIKEKKQ